ncbi:MAG: hypothetical protein R3192_09005 [Woeseiaceae bacterium]|nr:hypothetical protein [Woeseiaceae bacterium]
MSNDVTNWTELREFAAVDLEKSFVVDWGTEGETLLIDLDLFLLPEHPFYEKPRPSEGACFRQAVIEFGYCTKISAQGKSNAADPGQAIKSLQTGRISGMRRNGEGHYEIIGEFGTVGIKAERPLLRLVGRLA